MKNLFSQLIKFGLVGGIAFLIDYGIMVFLTEVFKIPSLISAAISFTVSVIFNYISSVKWVFDVDKEKNSKTKELVVFILLSIVGLGINELIMWIMDKEFGIYYKTGIQIITSLDCNISINYIILTVFIFLILI